MALTAADAATCVASLSPRPRRASSGTRFGFVKTKRMRAGTFGSPSGPAKATTAWSIEPSPARSLIARKTDQGHRRLSQTAAIAAVSMSTAITPSLSRRAASAGSISSSSDVAKVPLASVSPIAVGRYLAPVDSSITSSGTTRSPMSTLGPMPPAIPTTTTWWIGVEPRSLSTVRAAARVPMPVVVATTCIGPRLHSRSLRSPDRGALRERRRTSGRSSDRIGARIASRLPNPEVVTAITDEEARFGGLPMTLRPVVPQAKAGRHRQLSTIASGAMPIGLSSATLGLSAPRVSTASCRHLSGHGRSPPAWGADPPGTACFTIAVAKPPHARLYLSASFAAVRRGGRFLPPSGLEMSPCRIPGTGRPASHVKYRETRQAHRTASPTANSSIQYRYDDRQRRKGRDYFQWTGQQHATRWPPI